MQVHHILVTILRVACQTGEGSRLCFHNSYTVSKSCWIRIMNDCSSIHIRFHPFLSASAYRRQSLQWQQADALFPHAHWVWEWKLWKKRMEETDPHLTFTLRILMYHKKREIIFSGRRKWVQSDWRGSQTDSQRKCSARIYYAWGRGGNLKVLSPPDFPHLFPHHPFCSVCIIHCEARATSSYQWYSFQVMH